MGRMPARVRRRANQDGEGPTTTSVTTALATAASATGRPDGAGSGGSGTPRSGWRRAARSRAMPVMHHASGRLPSTVMSNTVSASRPNATIRGVPGSATTSSGRTRRPAPSSDRPSSTPEHSMPLDAIPFILRKPISEPSGRTAPTGASGTRSPTEKLGAPQTISSGSPPASTRTRRMRSAPLMAVISVTRLTTTSWRPSPTRSTPSTTSPRSSRAAASSPMSSGKGAKSRSQLSGARTNVFLVGWTISKLRQESDVVLHEGADVGDLVAHQGAAVDAEAEGEAGPLLGVDADGGEHCRIDHAAPSQLHPPGVRAGPAPAPPANGTRDLELG